MVALRERTFLEGFFSSAFAEDCFSLPLPSLVLMTMLSVLSMSPFTEGDPFQGIQPPLEPAKNEVEHGSGLGAF